MKNVSYANRGAPFEDYIRFANDRYELKKVALIDKLPTEFIPLRDRNGKVCNVKVEHKSKVDFIGRYKHYPIAIEAKHTNDDAIRFDAVQPHQADYMDAFIEEPGTIGLVLVSFGLKRFYAIPWAFWGAAYNMRVRHLDRKSPLTVTTFGTTWNIPKKASIRMDEIPPEFEVDPFDMQYSLHYLKNALRYVTTEHRRPNNHDGM